MDGFPVESFVTAAGQARAEIEVKRSRFLACVAPADTEAEARAIIDAERAAHPKARHWCTAFVLGPDARTQRCNDDGEPAGTAGAPILEVLTGHGLTNVVAVVTRYFGGTLLGAGGLVRAYGEATSAAVASLDTRRCVLRVPVRVTLDYAAAEAARVRCERQGWPVVNAVYGQAVDVTFGVGPGDVDAVCALLADVSGGLARPQVGEPGYV